MTDKEMRQDLVKRFTEKIEPLKVKNGKVGVTIVGEDVETVWLSKQHQVKRFSDCLNKIESIKLKKLYNSLITQ